MPPAIEPVAATLADLRAAGGGWMNLLPGIEEDAVDPDPPGGLFAVFGNRAAPVTMATLFPPKLERRETEGVSVGLLHPTGSRAAARLADAGVAVPPGWVVRQDHARRGLVLRTTVEATEGEIVSWSVAAGVALCRTDMTGRWQAVVYLP